MNAKKVWNAGNDGYLPRWLEWTKNSFQQRLCCTFILKSRLSILEGEWEEQKHTIRISLMRFVVLMAVSMMMIFWVVMSCRHAGRYRHFSETYYLCLHTITTQKNIITRISLHLNSSTGSFQSLYTLFIKWISRNLHILLLWVHHCWFMLLLKKIFANK
jgi:hypothetical protein